MSNLEKHEGPRWPDWLAGGWRSRLIGMGWPEFDEWFDRDAMRVEQFRDDDSIVVKAEMPGIDPDKDVEITVANGVLSIRVEREEKKEEKGDEGSYRSEFRYGRFVRNIPLPAGADEESVTATYTDGILEVRLPAGTEEAPKARKVPVTRD